VTTDEDDLPDKWRVTMARDGTVAISMSLRQAENLLEMAEQEGQSLSEYVRRCLRMMDTPMPELFHFHRKQGSYDPVFDRVAELGYPLITVTFGRIGKPGRVIMAASVEKTGATVTVAEEDFAFFDALHDSKADIFGIKVPRNNRRKNRSGYQFPDSEAGNA
jgi:hypothetical protein